MAWPCIWTLQNPSLTWCTQSVPCASKSHACPHNFALFSSQIFSQILLCKKKIPHHIKMPVKAWNTKCRWNQKLIV
jgi:hypothetical protein